MASRLDLHRLLLGLNDNKNVYFQRPESIKLSYPAIVYSLSDIDKQPADNSGYIKTREYTIIYIDPNPDSSTVDKLMNLPYCSFERHYKTDNLNHYVYRIFY